MLDTTVITFLSRLSDMSSPRLPAFPLTLIRPFKKSSYTHISEEGEGGGGGEGRGGREREVEEKVRVGIREGNPNPITE